MHFYPPYGSNTFSGAYFVAFLSASISILIILFNFVNELKHDELCYYISLLHDLFSITI